MGPHSQIKALEAALFKAERAHRSLGVLVIIHIQFNNSWSQLKKKHLFIYFLEVGAWLHICEWRSGGKFIHSHFSPSLPCGF